MKRTYRRVVSSYWTDPEIRKLRSPEAHALLLYLFTGPDSNPCGLYFQPLEVAASRTFVPIERVLELVDTLEELGIVAYDHETEEVLILGAIRHQVGDVVRPSDKRWKSILRTVADTHSDRLVAALVERYGDAAPWPDDVLHRARVFHIPGGSGGHGPNVENSRVSEGAPKGLIPHEARGSGASKRLSTEGASKHSMSMRERKSVSTSMNDSVSHAADAGPYTVRITDAVLREEARSGMGLGKFTSATDLAMVNREIQQLLQHVPRGDLLAAMRGFCKIRDAGELGFKPGKPYSPAVLVRWDAKPDSDGNPGLWYGEGDARTKRRLLDLAQELERREAPERGDRNAKLAPISEAFSSLFGNQPEAEA